MQIHIFNEGIITAMLLVTWVEEASLYLKSMLAYHLLGRVHLLMKIILGGGCPSL